MKPQTIKTDQRIFEVTNSEGETYLCNLDHFKLDNRGKELLTDEGFSIRLLKHYWNNTFKKIAKRDVKDIIIANFPHRETNKTA